MRAIVLRRHVVVAGRRHEMWAYTLYELVRAGGSAPPPPSSWGLYTHEEEEEEENEENEENKNERRTRRMERSTRTRRRARRRVGSGRRAVATRNQDDVEPSKAPKVSGARVRTSACTYHMVRTSTCTHPSSTRVRTRVRRHRGGPTTVVAFQSHSTGVSTIVRTRERTMVSTL